MLFLFLGYLIHLLTDNALTKVKFMKSIPGTSLVEMGDEFAAYRAISHLNGIRVLGTKLIVW